MLTLGIAAALLYYFTVFSFTWGSLGETVFHDTLFIAIMLGALFIGCAKEPQEDEMIDALYHMMYQNKTGSLQEYKEIEETFSPEVLSDIVDFIKSAQ